MTVSDDGNTLTSNWTYYGNPTGGPVSGTDTQTRVGKAPAGANAISGLVARGQNRMSPPATR